MSAANDTPAEHAPAVVAQPSPRKRLRGSTGPRFDESVTLEDLRGRLAAFAAERDWDQYHTPRNLVLALTGEVGELAEIFQWKGEVPEGLPGWTEAQRTHVGEELSDVLLYLLRLADKCDIDLAQAALRKLRRNAEKYPAELVRGRSDKYNEYKQAHRAREQNRVEEAGEQGQAAEASVAEDS